jgi:isocitrate/isopropylmalate dehydrogenase
MSDIFPSYIANTGTILTGSMGLNNTGSIDFQAPFFEDLSGSGGAYYPIFE